MIGELDNAWLFANSNWTSYFEVGDFHDVLTLPMIDLTVGPAVPLRFQPGEFAGYTVTHCHFLMHEDEGCMKVLEYTCPTQTNTTQGPLCPGFAWPVPPTRSET